MEKFDGVFRALAAITGRAKQLKITLAVPTARSKRNYVVNMVGIAEPSSAAGALSALSGQQINHVRLSVRVL